MTRSGPAHAEPTPDTPEPLVPTPQATPAVRRTRWLALALCTALIALCVAWEGWLAPTGRHTLVLKALPLVLAWPGLRRERLYTYRWLSLAVWLYAAEAGVRIWCESAMVTLLASLELLLTVALFAACAVHIRLRLAAGRRLAQAGSSAPSAT